MSFTPDAPIMRVKERFPEICAVDSSSVPFGIRITLNPKVEEEKKREIQDAVLECGFEVVDFAIPMLTETWCSDSTLELTDDQKRDIIQAHGAFATVLRDNGIDYQNTRWGFDLP